jgi:hypothetical protein
LFARARSRLRSWLIGEVLLVAHKPR